jgi:hypothetical protein
VLDTDGVWGAASSVALAQVAGNVAVDLSTGINFTLAMTGTPWTLSNPTNGKDGQSGKIEITQDATGTRILNFGANWLWVGGRWRSFDRGQCARRASLLRIGDGKVEVALNKALA